MPQTSFGAHPRLIAMRVAIILVLVALYLCAPVASAEEYRYAGSVVRVIDGDSLIIDVPDLPAPFPTRAGVGLPA